VRTNGRDEVSQWMNYGDFVSGEQKMLSGKETSTCKPKDAKGSWRKSGDGREIKIL